MGSNAVMKEHWQHLFNMPTSSQDSTLDEDLQRPERTELGDKPDDKEIIRFTRKAKSKKSHSHLKCGAAWCTSSGRKGAVARTGFITPQDAVQEQGHETRPGQLARNYAA